MMRNNDKGMLVCVNQGEQKDIEFEYWSAN